MEANSNQTSKEDFDESIILKLKVEIETSPSQVISNPGDWKISDFRNLIQLVTARADELNIQRKILKGVKKVHTKQVNTIFTKQSIWNEISIKISVFRPGSSSESCKKAWKRMENKYQVFYINIFRVKDNVCLGNQKCSQNGSYILRWMLF